MTTPAQPQPLSNGTIPVISQIQNQVKARNPQASPEQISAMTTDRLSQQYRINQQAAMQAAAGNNVNAVSHNASIKATSQSQQQMLMNGVNGRPPMNPQDYAHLMRSQQSNQQNLNAGGSGINVGRTVSRSATPQIHTRHAPSQSPRPSQVQMAGTQWNYHVVHICLLEALRSLAAIRRILVSNWYRASECRKQSIFTCSDAFVARSVGHPPCFTG